METQLVNKVREHLSFFTVTPLPYTGAASVVEYIHFYSMTDAG